ncbi:type I-B CRISPR-associated protein Cas8b1/Cst1 [Pampinifervens florentissimum]|uniref:type I-B CRISPR-associated protein Cas8b1/Cst1 n=1 Tax=Pampinifervens florentissimum TaxID=1632019 RepID=UPI0013B49384|nr:type I-B CRISPR-associated protein Cas8b1/Cst1 [Hydrogenobacter sp. T-8]QID33516.1 type I-B CRISPR-associated protein Cas8b1/Cst1 [Hydrogenobacter sp. T-8]
MAIRFRIDNWLMASSAVGFAKVLNHAKIDPLPYFKERVLEVPQDLWERLPELYADYLLKYPANISRLKVFYNNSPLTNPNPKAKISLNNKKEIEKFFQKLLSVNTSNNFPKCFFCKERNSYKKENFYKTFDAINFTPLSASPNTFPNLFYNGVNTMFLCKECEALLYFACFGFTDIERRYIFVYLPDDIRSMIGINNALETRKWISADIIKESLIEVVKSIEKYKAGWSLENIYVVEIQTVSKAQSNIYTFSLSQIQAHALREYIEEYPKSLNPLFDIFLKYVYYGKSLYHMLYKIMLGYIFAGNYEGKEKINDDVRLIKYGTEAAFKSERSSKQKSGLDKSLIYLIKFQEVLNMQANKEKEINSAFVEGKKLAQSYKESLGEDRAKNKIESLSYRLLEAVRRRDIDHFSQNLIRAYLEVEKPIPRVFLSAIKEEGLERIAYAFLIGLNGKEGKDESNTETEDSLGEE